MDCNIRVVPMPIGFPENRLRVIPDGGCMTKSLGKYAHSADRTRFHDMRILGIILIVVGLLAVGLPYVTFTKKEKVLDIGPIEAVAETQERIPISPIVGLLVFVGGVGIVIASVVKKS